MPTRPLLLACLLPLACNAPAPEPSTNQASATPPHRPSPAEPIAIPPADPPPAPSAPAPSIVPSTPPPPAAARALAAISAERLRDDVDALAAFGTRHTLSADATDRGIAAARRHLVRQFEDASTTDRPGPPLTVAEEPFSLQPDGRRVDRPATLVNVIATLPGTMPEAMGRRIYVIGHYDSRASDVMDPEAAAPGANDDASGVAVTLELARVLAPHPLDATVVFMATAGEEQGLLGARLHAAAAHETGAVITGVLSNDIVGDPTGPDGERHADRIRVFSSGAPASWTAEQLAQGRATGALDDGPARQLARYVATIAAWEHTAVQPTLVFRPDRFLRGGDHLAFDELGYPAIRFTEVAENYDRQHQDPRVEGDRSLGDLPEHVDEHYLAEVARLNGAVLVHLANAPSAPTEPAVVADALSRDTTVRWAPAPEPDVAGYEVIWRATTAPSWEHARDVGTATEITLPLHKDDWIFGVRTYDRDGHRSPVAACGITKA
ncbi:M20/M25/M40 family metallo-hydrolase [Paraliomyxa miuraensis]|uniref:M20/M25/M40 family metallo-hydrolase n=1 Tax=Paraliomyxa miuraensis TaxID=376150 RepID=UPI00224D3F35|nr:M20/M25/M40 family metallo-hydrolase [Paraliomyxa miuraensis]MCX4243250.1 M28 family peptidase [Paraliomyxa miuraensis]